MLLCAERFARLNLDRALVDRGCGDGGGIRAGRYEDGGYRLRIVRSGPDLDPRGIETLLLDQVVLGVDSALSGEVRLLDSLALRRSLFRSRCVADDVQRCIGGALQAECQVVEASLALVVDASRTSLVAVTITGGGGWLIETEVVAEACLPRSSTTMQVTVIVVPP